MIQVLKTSFQHEIDNEKILIFLKQVVLGRKYDFHHQKSDFEEKINMF